MSRPGSSDGFSLLEMLVALAIISLAAGVAYSGTSWRGSRETLITLSQKIAHAAAEATLRAISKGETTNVEVDVVKRLLSNGQDGGIVIPEPFKISVVTGASLIRQDRLGRIEFYADGTSSGGEIVLEEKSGKVKTIRISWLTGAITVQESVTP
jgi:general secretion pathway protein H